MQSDAANELQTVTAGRLLQFELKGDGTPFLGTNPGTMNTAARPYPLCPEGSTGTYPAPKEKKAPSRQALSGKRPSDTLPARHCQKGRPEDCHLPAVPSI